MARASIVSEVEVELTPEEVKLAKQLLGREPTPVEIGMIDVMWSEHCSYKSSKSVLKMLPTTGKRVLIGPGQDAGAVDVGNGYAIVFKIESHNHPSAIDPYNGAGTGIGGIIRDVLCMGARPIALLDALRFGPLSSPHSRWLFRYVVKGIADYGNRVGIPTLAGEVQFDESFEINCLVNVCCVGIAKRNGLVPSRMERPGDVLVLVGGSTGRDGIHGVTFASRTLSIRSEEDRPAVQIGDPFLKKIVIEATLEAIKTGYIHGLKDLGGGGLACASSEMAAWGGTGVEIWLERIHTREEGMDPFELVLSESQERMLFVVDPAGLDEVTRVFEKYDLAYAIVGKVTDTGKLVVRYRGEVVAELDPRILAEAPITRRKARKPRYLKGLLDVRKPPVPRNLDEVLVKLLASPNIASKEWVYRQYDHEVGVRTVLKPGDADAAVLRLLEVPNKAIAIKVDANSRHAYLDPYHGHAGAVAEAAQNVVAVGAEPIAMVNGCNFGNPEKPEVFWQFREAVRGMADMCRALGIPCVGGNVSFYNEDERTRKAVKPTTMVVMLGLIEDLSWITTMALKSAGDEIMAVGETKAELGGSEYYHEIYGIKGGEPPKVSPADIKKTLEFVLETIRSRLITAAHDCSKGGLAVALALMAIKGGVGLEADLAKAPRSGRVRLDELMFSESYGRFVITCRSGGSGKLIRLARKHGVPIARLGEVGGDRIVLCYKSKQLAAPLVSEAVEVWSKPIERWMEG